MSKKFDEMDSKERGTLMGNILGYPDCCIKEHVDFEGARGIHVSQTRGTNNPFMGTGFIPCEKCWNLSEEELTATINKKRHPEMETFSVEAIKYRSSDSLFHIIEKYYN